MKMRYKVKSNQNQREVVEMKEKEEKNIQIMAVPKLPKQNDETELYLKSKKCSECERRYIDNSIYP